MNSPITLTLGDLIAAKKLHFRPRRFLTVLLILLTILILGRETVSG